MRVLPVGEDALLVEVSSGDEAQALHAELLRRSGRNEEAAAAYEKALACPGNAADDRFLRRRLGEVRGR